MVGCILVFIYEFMVVELLFWCMIDELYDKDKRLWFEFIYLIVRVVFLFFVIRRKEV